MPYTLPEQSQVVEDHGQQQPTDQASKEGGVRHWLREYMPGKGWLFREVSLMVDQYDQAEYTDHQAADHCRRVPGLYGATDGNRYEGRDGGYEEEKYANPITAFEHFDWRCISGSPVRKEAKERREENTGGRDL